MYCNCEESLFLYSIDKASVVFHIAKYEEVISRWTGGVSPEMQALTAEMGTMLDRMEKLDLTE